MTRGDTSSVTPLSARTWPPPGAIPGHVRLSRPFATAQVYSEQEVQRHTFTVLQAIDFMHAKGIVHRDLKPENILLSDKSDSATIKVVDFGLSQCVVCSARARLQPARSSAAAVAARSGARAASAALQTAARAARRVATYPPPPPPPPPHTQPLSLTPPSSCAPHWQVHTDRSALAAADRVRHAQVPLAGDDPLRPRQAARLLEGTPPCAHPRALHTRTLSRARAAPGRAARAACARRWTCGVWASSCT